MYSQNKNIQEQSYYPYYNLNLENTQKNTETEKNLALVLNMSYLQKLF